jgi:hypothetical protein
MLTRLPAGWGVPIGAPTNSVAVILTTTVVVIPGVPGEKGGTVTEGTAVVCTGPVAAVVGVRVAPGVAEAAGGA